MAHFAQTLSQGRRQKAEGTTLVAVVVLDVRDPASFAKGRIPGAINIDYTMMLKQGERFAGEPVEKP